MVIREKRIILLKAAYKYLMSGYTLSSTNVNTGVWNSIWILQVPFKVRHLVWGACANCLPTNALQTKQVDVTETCPMCNAKMEDTLHVLVKCLVAKSVWCQTEIGDQNGLANTFISWWQLILQGQQKEQINLAAMICWNIWNVRNNLVWNGNVQ